MTSFSIEKLTTVWNHRRPWQVQKLTSMSIFEREFLLGKNVAAADRMSVVLHSIEFFIRKTRSAQMYKDVHLCAMSSVVVLKRVSVKVTTV